MKKMNASEFKAKCLKILDHPPKEGLTILKHGKPVAIIRPYQDDVDILDFVGSLDCKVDKKDNLFSTEEKWNAES